MQKDSLHNRLSQKYLSYKCLATQKLTSLKFSGKRKLDSQISENLIISEKFKLFASEKMEYVEMQKELLKLQLVDEQEKLEHNRLLRSMELEDAKAKYDHNEILRKLELEKFLLNKQN